MSQGGDQGGYLAYGTRGLAKLIESLGPDTALTKDSLLSLNGLLSNQEAKLAAIAHQSPPLVPELVRLLASPEEEVQRLAATALGSLVNVYQGRVAAQQAGAVAALEIGLCGSVPVAAASGEALRALSLSRDGCQVLMQFSTTLMATLTHSLSGASPVMRPCVANLANLLRLDLGVSDALAAGIVPALHQIISTARRSSDELKNALQALWNLSNSHAGKAAVVEGGLLPTLSTKIESGTDEVKRLAAGCIMAVAINKEGKIASDVCVVPLIELAMANRRPRGDAGTLKDATLALKAAAEYPPTRKLIERYARSIQKDPAHIISDLSAPMFDSKPWPASLRCVNQWKAQEAA
jgi:hypothetical protein